MVGNMFSKNSNINNELLLTESWKIYHNKLLRIIFKNLLFIVSFKSYVFEYLFSFVQNNINFYNEDLIVEKSIIINVVIVYFSVLQTHRNLKYSVKFLHKYDCNIL